jgi:hypothetical protein
MTVKRTYEYPAFLECQDGSFVAIDRLWEQLITLGSDDGIVDEARRHLKSLTPAAREEFERYVRDRIYDLEEKHRALMAELGVGPSLKPS